MSNEMLIFHNSLLQFSTYYSSKTLGLEAPELKKTCTFSWNGHVIMWWVLDAFQSVYSLLKHLYYFMICNLYDQIVLLGGKRWVYTWSCGTVLISKAKSYALSDDITVSCFTGLTVLLIAISLPSFFWYVWSLVTLSTLSIILVWRKWNVWPARSLLQTIILILKYVHMNFIQLKSFFINLSLISSGMRRWSLKLLS